MLNHKSIAALAEHGDIWCMNLDCLGRFLADGERKATPRIPRVSGHIAVIPLQGVITKRGGYYSDGLDRVLRTVEAAMSAKAIGGIILDVDSPGGSSYGLMEFADRIHAMRDADKPLLAVSNPLAASAAYWAGSAADQFIVSPSGDVGSVGVWSLHMDWSKAIDEAGLKPTFVYAGKYKVEGNPFEPLSDEAREEIQRGVDEVYNQFISAVSRNRGVQKSKVLADFGQGRIISADRAKAAGMVDRVASMDDVITTMSGGNNSTGHHAETLEDERNIIAAWNGSRVDEVSGTHVESLRRKRERKRRK